LKPRIVLDTNNLISGIFFEKGNEARVLDETLAGGAKLLASLEALQEFQETVSRPKFQLSASEALAVFQLIIHVKLAITTDQRVSPPRHRLA